MAQAATLASIGRLAKMGPIVQIAFVPQDFDAAIRFWTEVMGAGPFFVIDHIPHERVLFRGHETQPDISAALGYWGDMIVELIVQHNDAPSVYREWLDQDGKGVQHVGVLSDDVPAARRNVIDIGGEILQDILLKDGSEAFYATVPGFLGTILEVIPAHERLIRMFASFRNAAQGWDGSDPVRPATL
jgi:catechol 2,3-dioxygenase-like lactoylglutathione lyase family enzyme